MMVADRGVFVMVEFKDYYYESDLVGLRPMSVRIYWVTDATCYGL